MLHLQQIAAIQDYYLAAEHTERERKSREALLVATARRTTRPAPGAQPKRSFVPRIAGALGLF